MNEQMCRVLTWILLLGLSFGGPLMAQSGSIDYQGPSIGLPSGGVGPLRITPGAIFTAFILPGPLPPVTILIPEGPGGLGLTPSPITGLAEVDALSYGLDLLIQPNASGTGWLVPPVIAFAVDEFAVGIPGAPFAPNVTTEGAAGNLEASADVLRTLPGFPLAPLPPGLVNGNFAGIDGDGLFPFGGPGLGLFEPDVPAPGFPDTGDNIDAVEQLLPSYPIYYSLDDGLFDPLEGLPNTGTAFANGVTGGTVVVTLVPGGAPQVYAKPTPLGLGPKDDIDALALNENGDGRYTPSKKPYDWVGGRTDMLLFSVRRGSPIIGTPDSLFGAKIEEGDILTTPYRGVGGPAIFIPAEALGLATVRSSYVPRFGDDLNGMSIQP